MTKAKVSGWRGGAGERRELAQDATVRLPPGEDGVVVRVERGVVLVTQAGDLEDHVLEPGDAVRVRPRGLAVAWALRPATIRVLGALRLERRDGDDRADGPALAG